MEKKPDVLKLARSTEDALTGLIWMDDAQVWEMQILKRYSEGLGADITVETL